MGPDWPGHRYRDIYCLGYKQMREYKPKDREGQMDEAVRGINEMSAIILIVVGAIIVLWIAWLIKEGKK